MLHQCRKRSPVFTHCVPPSSSFPTNPSLPSCCLPLAFPQTSTQTRFITIHQVSLSHASLLCSLQLCQERRGRGGQGEGRRREKQETSYDRKEYITIVLSVSGCVYKHILPDSCMHELFSLPPLTEKSSGEQSCRVLNTEISFPLLCFEFITRLLLNPLRSYTQIIICADILTKHFIHENGHNA